MSDDAKTSLALVINSGPHTQIIPENHQAKQLIHLLECGYDG